MAKSPLEAIPGVGPAMAEAFNKIGIARVEQLKGKDPAQLYTQLNQKLGYIEDRCVLYVFRCAVYYAQTDNPDMEKLKWWNWKD